MLRPVAVWRVQAQSLPRVALRIPSGLGAPLRATLELVHEDGHRVEMDYLPGLADPGARLSVELPHAPPEGYHDVRVWLRGPTGECDARQRLVVAPRTALTARESLGPAAAHGVFTNLYSVRSDRGFGSGDFADLHALVDGCSARGLDFVGLNPLHALRYTGDGISPYNPVSRIFRSWLYLDMELAVDRDAQTLLASSDMQALLARLRGADRLDYQAIRDAKCSVLRVLHRTFAARHRSRDTERGRAHATYRAIHGAALDDFATFAALDAHLSGDPAIGGDMRRWPAHFRNPRSPEVAAFRGAHADEIAFARWLQFETDRQLAVCATRARDAGMRVGLYSDLAVGSAPDSADVWAHPELFARGVHVGAPPDDYSATGQDWGFPPIDPHRLE
jgi:4-alpha-glucanotransferase